MDQLVARSTGRQAPEWQAAGCAHAGRGGRAGLRIHILVGHCLSGRHAAPPIVARLHAEISMILGSAEAREYFGSLGLSAGADSMESSAVLICAEHAQWGDIVRQTGMKAE